MASWLDNVKPYAGILGKGLLLEMAPGIAGGVINELFHQWKMDVSRVTKDVQSNRSLWDDMTPDQREQLKNLGSRIGSLDFVTPDLIVNSIKKDFPAVASLFVGWPEAGEWLDRQVNDLKAGVTGLKQ